MGVKFKLCIGMSFIGKQKTSQEISELGLLISVGLFVLKVIF